MNDEVAVDFARSHEQSPGPTNPVLSVAWSATYAMLHLTDPEIPRNSYAFRPIRIVAPPRRVVNCDYPAAEVGGNTETHVRVCYTIVGALAKAVPERVVSQFEFASSRFLSGRAFSELMQRRRSAQQSTRNPEACR